MCVTPTKKPLRARMDKKTFAVDIQMEALLFRVESKHGDKIQIENYHMLLEHEGCSMQKSSQFVKHKKLVSF